MFIRNFSSRRLSIIASLALVFVFVPTVSAQTSSSTNYKVTESFFGTGGELEAGSANYKSKQSAGELTVGAIRSTLYSAQAGFNTDREPYVAMAVLTPSVDVGVLNSGHANVGTAQFWTKAYLSDGYVVQSYGASPTNSGHALSTASSNSISLPGLEQFGINLAVNHVTGAESVINGEQQLREDFGAAPTQFPEYVDDPFGFGQVADGINTTNAYNVANRFRYNSGDVIAFSKRSSSDTTFTISYLFNVNPVTPAGTYTMAHVLVATASF